MSREPARALFDPGLQPERTWLSWRRTLLSLVAAALAALRIVPAALGPAWLVVAAAGVVAALAVLWLAGRRSRRTDAALRAAVAAGAERPALPGAAPLALLAALVLAGGLVSLVVVLGLPPR